MKNILSRKVVISTGLILIVAAVVWQGIVTRQRLARLEKVLAVTWEDTHKEYDYRASLVPQLLKAASATANFDNAATTDLLQAQAEAEQIKLDPMHAPSDADELKKYDQAQAALTKSLFHVVAVPLRHPEMKVTSDFRNLSSQLIELQTNIAIARNRFIGTAQTYDQTVNGFPGLIYSFILGFRARPYFAPQQGSSESVANITPPR